jgi:hypothetical protein
MLENSRILNLYKSNTMQRIYENDIAMLEQKGKVHATIVHNIISTSLRTYTKLYFFL